MFLVTECRQGKTRANHKALQGVQRPDGDGEPSHDDRASQDPVVGDVAVSPGWLS